MNSLSNEQMLKFDKVSFAYEADQLILKDLSFAINKGDFVSLIGQSGCGKSTVFRLILGFETAQSGNIMLASDKTKIGYMPQKDLLFPWRTVAQNLALPLEVQKLSASEITARVSQILDDMELANTKDLYPSELSGGMRQRIAFARTVLTGADLLLLDEPFSALDYFTRMDFQDWIIRQYMRLNKTIFFITHSVEEAILLSNRILIFKDSLPVEQLQEVCLTEQYPREQHILNQPQFINLKTTLVDRLRKPRKA